MKASPTVSQRLAELVEAPAVRFVLRETPEGRLIAERLTRSLRAPELRELELRLDHIAAVADDEAALRALAARELRIDAAAGRECLRFLPGGATSVVASPRSALQGAAPLAPRLSVAAVQYPIEPTKTLPQTLARVEDCVALARAGGADVVMLPELFVLERVSYAPGSASEAAQLERIAREETPALFDHVAELARRYEVAVLGGTSPRVIQVGLVNTAILAFPSGRRVLQDKLFLTPDEVAWGWVRGEELRVFEAPWGRSAILICYDSQFSAVSSAIAPLAPELLFIPSMTTPKGLSRVRWSAQARAVEHHAYVVLTGAVAPARPALFTGQATILTPQDTGFPGVLVEGRKNQAELVFGALDLARLRDSRAQAGLYSARDAQRRDRPLRVVSE